MEHDILKSRLVGLVPELVFPENKQFIEIIVSVHKLHLLCLAMKTADDLFFDYLINLTAVDWKDHYMMVYHITSTQHRHTVVLKTRIDDRENPEADTVSDIWRAAEFYEREVYDLFGIRFRNHPDLRRLFLEEDYGFPLRKDFIDESRMIIR
jgi:NADH:ubiquinone oxidoreductase subunit C